MDEGVNTADAEERSVPTKQSLSSVAYFAIRDMLITVRLPPGSPVQEEQLAHELGVGRTPIREAIKRLEAERLVKIYPRRGVFATDVHLSDLSLLTEVRSHLEGEAAYQAASRANEQQRRRLRELLQETSEHGREAATQIGFDTKVHRCIYESARNPYLEATLTQYYNLILRIWYLFIERLPEVTDHVGELAPLLQAVIDADGENARKIAVEHVNGFEKAVLSVL